MGNIPTVLIQRKPTAMWPRRKALIVLAALLPGLFLAGCESTAPMQRYPELTFGHLGRISLDVARVEIATRYIPPLKAPNVEHLSPTPPYVAIRRWAGQRLVAAGRQHTAHLVILDASIKEVPLRVKGGLSNLFTRQQAMRYDGRAAVLLEIIDSGGRQLAFVTARASRSTTVAEGASLAAREKVWFTLTEDIVTEINRRLEREIRRHFRGYVIGG
jgi:hypothetical protein